MNTEQPLWPPEYRLRKSRRAKYLQLKVCPEVGLEVVVPYRMGYYNLDELFSTHRIWIERKLKNFRVRERQKIEIPTQLLILMTGESWQIQTIPAFGKTKLMIRPDRSLILMGDVSNIELCQKLLKLWLRRYAQKLLIPMMEQLSAETELLFTKITIREQKSRWGSCSAKGNIALNCRLIYLPIHLVRYILIHELCHTRHFNHSKRFWNLVAKFDTNYLQHKREIQRLCRDTGPWGLVGTEHGIY